MAGGVWRTIPSSSHAHALQTWRSISYLRVSSCKHKVTALTRRWKGPNLHGLVPLPVLMQVWRMPEGKLVFADVCEGFTDVSSVNVGATVGDAQTSIAPETKTEEVGEEGEGEGTAEAAVTQPTHLSLAVCGEGVGGTVDVLAASEGGSGSGKSSGGSNRIASPRLMVRHHCIPPSFACSGDSNTQSQLPLTRYSPLAR